MGPLLLRGLLLTRVPGSLLNRHGAFEAALGARFVSSAEGASAEADVTPDLFLTRIGKGCEGLVDKFPGGLQEILGSGGQKLKKMGVAVKQRKLIMRHTEQFKQGVWHPIPAVLKARKGRMPAVATPLAPLAASTTLEDVAEGAASAETAAAAETSEPSTESSAEPSA
ncbi:hypothetical protein KFL_001240030 [Klebsormidium nitens]|uniref:Small ribosomal subunit protein mS41 n=1 Tax=Klebsormidium nitens TaxID=105231 RepID=A0A1Y1I0U4_KLENI|nr:hypothetical protein KFL_001240030 [Klebsormidium nitens]|eukprot:GAQ82771.1 hypothetical protein KFL_001240030 [Klebsormidium nitens]